MSARTYVVGLPVLVTVDDDGTVTAEVDMSEADDLWSGEPDYPTGVVDADIRTIAAAVAAGMLRPEPSLHRPRPARRFQPDGFPEGPSLEAIGEGPRWNGCSTPLVTADAVRDWADRVARDDRNANVSAACVSVRDDGSLVVARLDDPDDVDTWPVYGLSDDGTPTYALDGWVFVSDAS